MIWPKPAPSDFMIAMESSRCCQVRAHGHRDADRAEHEGDESS